MQQFIDTLLSPLTFLYEIILNLSLRLSNSFVISLFMLALFQYYLFSPFKAWARKFKEKEQLIQGVMLPQIQAIPAEVKGHHRHELIGKIYKRYNYRPIFAIRNSAELLIQVPFFVAAYSFLSTFDGFKGQSITLVSDLSQPDKILNGINLLPLAMTAVSLFAAFFTPGLRASEKRIVASISLVFLVLLYSAPAGLVIFWTCNNVISFFAESGFKNAGAIFNYFAEKIESFCNKNLIHLILLSIILFFLSSYLIHPSKSVTYVQKYLSVAFVSSSLLLVWKVLRFGIKDLWIPQGRTQKIVLAASLISLIDYSLSRFFLKRSAGVFASYEVLKLVNVMSIIVFCIPRLSFFNNKSFPKLAIAPLSLFLAFILTLGGVVINFYFANFKAMAFVDLVVILASLTVSVIFIQFFFQVFRVRYSLVGEFGYVLFFCFLAVLCRPMIVGLLKKPVDLALVEQFILIFVFSSAMLFFSSRFKNFILKVTFVFFVTLSLNGLAVHLGSNRSSSELSDSSPTETDERLSLVSNFKHRPNIYLLIYDSYVHNSQLNEYGIDNSQHERFLKDQGFEIYQKTYTGTAPASLPSMAGVLDISFDTAKRIPENNLVNQVLKREGYETNLVLGSYFYQGLSGPAAYDSLYPNYTSSWLTDAFKEGILVGEHKFNLSFESVSYLEKLKRKRLFLSGEFEVPQFMYFHSAFPSHSQNSGVCLENEIGIYEEKLQQANKEMKEDLLALAGRDDSSIVIVAGDHGPYLTGDCAGLLGVSIGDLSRLGILDRHGMFLAIKWPAQVRTAVNREGYALQELFSLVFDSLAETENSPRPSGEAKSWRGDASGEPPIKQGLVNWGKDSGGALYLSK